MAEIDDFELLADYAGNGSEAAFTALVERHISVVHSAALRQVRDSHLAEEVTQVVFVLLARKARTFRRGVILSAWLLRATRFTSTNLLVGQFRRIRREQEAVQMQNNAPDDSAWEQIAPLLDEAMSRLAEKDRNVLALRFFEQKSLEEVGAALGIDAGAAQKRVWRAVERLRQYFSRRGVTFSVAGIATALSAHAIHVAPTGLAATTAAAAVLKGTAAPPATATLIKETLKLMAWTKAKTVVASVVVLLAGTTATVTVNKIHRSQNYPWQVPGFNGSVLAGAPPQIAILPSKVPYAARGYMGSKMMGTGVSAQTVVEAAYSDLGGGLLQTVVTADLPKGTFDYIASLPNGNTARLQEEVKRQFGVTARIESRESNVLALTVKNANAPGLKPATGSAGSSRAGRGEYSAKNQPLAGLVYFLSSNLGSPVIDRTGETGNFDFQLKWDATDAQQPKAEALKQALLDQLGLELVPGAEPGKTLVIEKAK